MKNFLTNLLIGFAFALCALIVFQWVREAHLHKKIQSLTDTLHDQSEAIQNLQGRLKKSEAEVTRLEALKVEMTETIKTNRLEIARLEKELDKALADVEKGLTQIKVYKDAIAKANEDIRTQNESIKKQNEDLKKLVQERSEMAQKFNKLAEDYNDLVKKWNAQQEELNKASEAAKTPPKK